MSLVIALSLLSASTIQCYASPPRSDDAWNPVINDLYYEMWWFDAQTEAGEYICCGIAVIGNIEKDARVRIDLMIYTADGGMVDATRFYSFSDFHASTERLEISVGNCYARENPPHYEVFLSNGTVSCYLYYRAEMSSWKKTKLRQDSYGTWIVIFPKGKVSGWYYIAGQRHEVTGVGYHDHTYLLTPTVNGYMWIPNIWGRTLSEGTAVVFGIAPMKYEVVALFFTDNLYELSGVSVKMNNDSFQIIGYAENAVASLELTVTRRDLVYESERWRAYRGLFSARGYFFSTTFMSPLKGKGIIFFPTGVPEQSQEF